MICTYISNENSNFYTQNRLISKPQFICYIIISKIINLRLLFQNLETNWTIKKNFKKKKCWHVKIGQFITLTHVNP